MGPFKWHKKHGGCILITAKTETNIGRGRDDDDAAVVVEEGGCCGRYGVVVVVMALMEWRWQ